MVSYRVVAVVAGNSEAVTLTGLKADTQYQLTVAAVWQGKKYRSRPIVFRTLGEYLNLLTNMIILPMVVTCPDLGSRKLRCKTSWLDNLRRWRRGRGFRFIVVAAFNSATLRPTLNLYSTRKTGDGAASWIEGEVCSIMMIYWWVWDKDKTFAVTPYLFGEGFYWFCFRAPKIVTATRHHYGDGTTVTAAEGGTGTAWFSGVSSN